MALYEGHSPSDGPLFLYMTKSRKNFISQALAAKNRPPAPSSLPSPSPLRPNNQVAMCIFSQKTRAGAAGAFRFRQEPGVSHFFSVADGPTKINGSSGPERENGGENGD
jgi:hypothetical protein